jgi:biopolymer transport protein ExbD
MADIAVLLTIFFLLISGPEFDRAAVDLPTSKVRTQAPRGAARVVLSQAVGPHGEVERVYAFSDGSSMSAEVGGLRDIYLEATRLTYVEPNTRFVLEADGTVRYEHIDDLLDALRAAGASNVVLLTAQETVEAAP